jgi:hypothetical protein
MDADFYDLPDSDEGADLPVEEHDQDEIFEQLGVENDLIMLSKITVEQWGAEVLLECYYQQEKQPFSILLTGCKSLAWDIHQQPSDHDLACQVIAILLGAEDHQASAIIYTDLFELAISYAALDVVKGW